MSKILSVLIFIITGYWLLVTPARLDTLPGRAGYCAYAESERGTFAQVERLFLRGNYEKAIYEADRLIESRSAQKDELYYLKGLSQLKLARFKNARESFENIISGSPRAKRAFDAYVAIGDSHFLEGDVDAALRTYQDVLNRYPHDKNISTVHYRIENCFKKRGFEDKRAKPAGSFSVQVGSFKNKKNAEKLTYKLSREGFDSFMETPVSSDDRLYRVKVGKLESKEEAEALASRLRGRGYNTKICR